MEVYHIRDLILGQFVADQPISAHLLLWLYSKVSNVHTDFQQIGISVAMMKLWYF